MRISDWSSDVCSSDLSRGLLVVEIKGGRIALDYAQREWTSTDRHGVAHPIKNPFEQARRGKYGILEKLSESPRWRKLGIGRLALGYAAYFPDVGDGGRLSGPAAPARINAHRSEVHNLPPRAASV